MDSIGDRIKSLRKSMKMNQKKFSSLIDISQGTLSDIERGIFKPSIDTIISISNKFYVSSDWLLKGGWEGLRVQDKELEYIIAEAFNRLFFPALDKICNDFKLPIEDVYTVFGKIVTITYNNNFQVNEYDLYHIFEKLSEDEKRDLIEIAKIKYQLMIKNSHEKSS